MDTPINLTVALAVYNEETNLGACLESVKHIADEIVIVDGGSTDSTVALARSFGAVVIKTDNPPVFHINKQKALDASHGRWILQLDADERVSEELGREIHRVVAMSEEEIRTYRIEGEKLVLLQRHMQLLWQRDGRSANDSGPVAAFFIPRKNYFLGTFLMHGGVYPDGTIRLVRNGRAHYMLKDVHDQMMIDGTVSFLSHDLIHMADPDFSRYLKRSDRYTTLLAKEWYENYLHRNDRDWKNSNTIAWSHEIPGVIFASRVRWMALVPFITFMKLYFRHGGYRDGFAGFVWAMYSSLHISSSYVKYWEMRRDRE